MDQQPWGWGLRERSCSHTRGHPLMAGDQQGWGDLRGLRGMERSVAIGLWGLGKSGACARSPGCGPEHYGLGCVPPGREGNWVPDSRFWRVDPRREQLLAVRRRPGVAEGRVPRREGWGRARATREAGHLC